MDIIIRLVVVDITRDLKTSPWALENSVYSLYNSVLHFSEILTSVSLIENILRISDNEITL